MTTSRNAAAGVYDHAGWAVVICVAGSEVIDRRRIDLVEPGVPCLPHHHPAQHVPLDEGVALVERVRASAVRCVESALDALPAGIGAIALRQRPTLPPTVAERIQSYYAQTRADTVMYREVIIEAAVARHWRVLDYDVKTVFADAAGVLGVDDISQHLAAIGKSLGAPWTKDHRLATAAGIVAAAR